MASHVSFRPSDLTGQVNTERLNTRLAQSAVRLSATVRTDAAAQGSAGGAVETLRAVVSGLDVVQRGISDAANMTKAADVGLSQASEILRHAQALAVQATSPVLTDEARTGLAVEWNAMMEQLGEVGKETVFGGYKLLEGQIGNTVGDVRGGDVEALNIVSSGLPVGDIGVRVVAPAQRAQVIGAEVSGPSAPVAAGVLMVNDTVVASLTGAQTAAEAIESINAHTDVTGVSARLGTEGAGAGHIVLETEGFGSRATIRVRDTGGAVLATPGTMEAVGVDAVAEVTIGDGQADTWSFGKGLTIGNAAGDRIDLTEAAGSVAQDLGTVATFEPGGYSLQDDLDPGQAPTLVINSVDSNALGLADVDLSTPSGARDAVGRLERAIGRIQDDAARVAAFRTNVLESRSQALAVARENVAASQSALGDPHYSTEMMETAAAQVLVQAAVAFSAQAQTLPHSALQLTK